MRILLIPLLLLVFAFPALADDLTGKSVTVKVDGLQLGRKLDGGLVRDGDALSAKKSYVVKADDGTFLELAGGFVFKSDVDVVAGAEFPKKFVKDAEGETPKDRWAFGTVVMPTKHTDKIQFGDWIDDKQEYFKLSGIGPMYVRKDNGDGWVRIHDGHREGWVQKENLVTKEDAPIFWDKAVKADPKDIHALYMRGCGWQEKGELDNAIADYNECIRLKPAQSEYYVARGTTRHDKKEFDKAIADYTEAIRLDPESGIAYFDRGLSLHSKMEYEKAITDYSEALRLDPKYAKSYFNRGKAWSDSKNYDKAIADYTEAIKLDSKYLHAYHGRAHAWGATKDYDKAIADYTEAIRIDPKYVAGYNNRGYRRFYQKEYAKAMVDFNAALKIDPNHANANCSKAETLAKLKKYAEAVEHFDRALKLNPSASIHQLYSFFRATCPDAKYRDGKKAVEMAKLAIEKAGKDAGWEYSATLAAAYAETGDFELAVTEQRKALDDKHIDATDKKVQEARLALYRAKKPYRDE